MFFWFAQILSNPSQIFSIYNRYPHSDYIKYLMQNEPFVIQENDFNLNEAFCYMQRGLPASYDYADYIYVVDKPDKKAIIKDVQAFRDDLSRIVVDSLHMQSQILITSFATEVWNQISENKIDNYTPSWEIPPLTTKTDSKKFNQVHQKFPERKKEFYKFDMKMFFQVKKTKKDKVPGTSDNSLTLEVIAFLDRHNLPHQSPIEGSSRQICGTQNAIIAGRFNDNQEKPKDPYTFYLHCLVGYDQPQHLGGSYLLVQQCVFDWFSIHNASESLPGVIGRNQIKEGSTIFSQHHCPHSHITASRIKDNQGNPMTLFRESKSFSSSTFEAEQMRSVSDNLSPQEGLMFISYRKDPYQMEKMLLNQLGNSEKTHYWDGLLNHFKVTHGNMFYTPNIVELIGGSPNSPFFTDELSNICHYHQVKWLKDYNLNQQDEKRASVTGNPYYLYSRAGYLNRMSKNQKNLNPPSARTLRIISRTFSLWQDTWYHDRRQAEMKHLQEYMTQHSSAFKDLYTLARFEGVNSFGENYTDIPHVIRNGLAIYYNLAHLVSTSQYGCRGPIRGNPANRFGSNTFHLEPEDVLVGGEANLTFGQGKHLVEYLTQEEMKELWSQGTNLSAHSGVGHIMPYLEEIIKDGLSQLIRKFEKKVEEKQQEEKDLEPKDKVKSNLFRGSLFALLGLQTYFRNYARLAREMSAQLRDSQKASKQSLNLISQTMHNLATSPPKTLHQGAQLILSIFIALHLTGEPVSIGRIDYLLKNFVPKPPPGCDQLEPSQEEQDIIDSFWLKVGEKANFNKGFFEDHQKWGNLAMGGSSNPYPQGASFNQWGHQLTCGGTNQKDGSPFYNVLTVACLRACRTIPVNAPCLGFRVQKNTPQFLLKEAAKAVLAGGAHPIIINDEKVIAGLKRCGNYKISQAAWNAETDIDVDYNLWDPRVDHADAYNFGSDGCFEFLVPGKSWFWLGGGCVLQPLEYVINVGKSLAASGPRYIHGKRQTYRWKELKEYDTYQKLQDEYFEIFFEIMSRNFLGELSGFENISKICPATLLNAFTANMRDRESDFYLNGTTYRIFAPQYTGLPNLTNALWNIKTLVFEQKVTTLEEIRRVLLVNWGEQLDEPFVPRTLPSYMKQRLADRCEVLRQTCWRQKKFGVDREVTEFGYALAQRMSHYTRKIFEEPSLGMLKLFKRLTKAHATPNAKFGFQYTPGCGTFENYADFGHDIGASFDGRKKNHTLVEDLAPQNFLMDKHIGDPKYQWKEEVLGDMLRNYAYSPRDPNDHSPNYIDPEFFSGAVFDISINEDFPLKTLTHNIKQFAEGIGPNLITISTGERKLLIDARLNTERDLIRLRMGGWTQFVVAMFPHLLEQHIRRKRQIPKPKTECCEVSDDEEETTHKKTKNLQF